MRKKIIWTISIFMFALACFMVYQLYFEVQPSIEDILKESNFSQTKPPNRLMSPGSIVVVDSIDTGLLTLICPCQNAFGKNVEKKILQSPSTNIDLSQQIKGGFSLDLSYLNKLSFKPDSKVIRNVTLKLSNVKILEIPDDAVFELLKYRTSYCVEAINKKKKEGKKVTLVKRVLQADAEYTVEFTNEINNDVKTEIMDELSIELIGNTTTTISNKIVGENLYWGVDDDASLGNIQPGELPATGSGSRRRITNKNSIYKVEYEKVHHNISPIKQPTEMSCWAAVYTMMLSWKDQKNYSIEEVVNNLGSPWKEYYYNDTGLPADKVVELLEITGLYYKPPASYMMEVYENLLKEKGPIWITSGDDIRSHAKLLIGIYENPLNNKSSLEFIDPLDGKIQRLELLEFVNEYEKEPHFINTKRPDLPFRIQIIHF